MKVVYICYPYSDNPQCRIDEVKTRILPEIVKIDGIIPLVPHLALLEFQEKFGRQYCMNCALELVRRSDELWVYSNELSEGMKMEIEEAKQKGIPILYKTKNI